MVKTIGRRTFFKNTTLSAAGIFLDSNLPELASNGSISSKSFNIMNDLMKYRKIDAHEHVDFGDSLKLQLDVADRLGIERLVISRPIHAGSRKKATPEEFRKCNDLVLQAIKQYPKRYLGSCFINPVYGKESLEEIKRCIDQGMIGLKVYNQVKINNPLFYPIIEKFIENKLPRKSAASTDSQGISLQLSRHQDCTSASVEEVQLWYG